MVSKMNPLNAVSLPVRGCLFLQLTWPYTFLHLKRGGATLFRERAI